MKTSFYHFTLVLLFTIALALISNGLKAQTTKTVGAGGDYTTLKASFDAINTGLITGDIILQIVSNTTETATAMLNASGFGDADYTSVLIYPTQPSLLITSSFSGPLVDLNGANNLIIDGRQNQTGEPALTLEHSSTTFSPRTIRFINGASNNIIRYVTLKGSTPASEAGMVFFAGTETNSGNSNNIIEYCNLTNSNGSRARNTIYSAGTIGFPNHNNIIRNNKFYDFFRHSAFSAAININDHSSAWIIEGNSFYETTVFVPEGAHEYRIISIATSASNNFLVRDNFIGGTEPQAAGSKWTAIAGFGHRFRAFYIETANTGLTILENNVIRNFDYTTTYFDPWDAFRIQAGNVHILGNTIGESTGNGSITVTLPVAYLTAEIESGSVTNINIIGGGSGYETAPNLLLFGGGGTGAAAETVITGGVITGVNILNGGTGYTTAPQVRVQGYSTDHGMVHGIIVVSVGDVEIRNNNMGSITMNAYDYYAHGFEGVYKSNGQAGNTLIENNLFGSLTTPHSIHSTSTAQNAATGQRVYGVHAQGTGNMIVRNNTFANITNNYTGDFNRSITTAFFSDKGNNTIEDNLIFNLTTYSAQTGSNNNASLFGIAVGSNTVGFNPIINGNEIHSLYQLNPTASVHLYGIFYRAGTDAFGELSGNFIHNLISSSSNLDSHTTGILLQNGKVNCINNLIVLGENLNSNHHLRGIFDQASAASDANVYFNTVLISGSVSGETSSSYAFFNQNNNTIRNYINNIFVNTRSGGTGGRHYAIQVAGTNNLSINYNNYFAPNGVLGRLSFDRPNLASWQTGTGQDANSLSVDPSFINASGSSAGSFIPLQSLDGISLAGITTDYFGAGRAATPTMGAIEKAIVWAGPTSTDWGTASNWNINAVPLAGDNIIIPDGCPHYPVLDQDRITGNLFIAPEGSVTIPPQLSFTVNGDLINEAGAQGIFILSNPAGTGSMLHNTNNIGGTIERYIAAAGYHLVSVPVSQSINPLSGLFLWSYLFNFDIPSQKWIGMDHPTNSPLFVDRGYMIYKYPGPEEWQPDTTYTFSGPLHNGLFTMDVSYPAAGGNFALVPNPYPSAIDWNQASGWTKTNLNASIWIWDPVSKNYGAWNGSLGTLGVSKDIPVGQSFFVQANAPGAALSVNNNARLHSSQPFLKQNNEINDLLRINAIAQGGSDEILIHFHPDASPAFDRYFDAYKLAGGQNAPQLFSLSADGRELSINCLPYSHEIMQIPVAFRMAVVGEVRLEFENIESFRPDLQLYLHDFVTDQTIDLKTSSSYTFEHDILNDQNRFMMMVNGLTSVPSIQSPDVYAAIINNHLHIEVPAALGTNYLAELFNAGGQVVLRKTVEPGLTRLPMQGLSRGVYVLKLSGNDRMAVKKLVY